MMPKVNIYDPVDGRYVVGKPGEDGKPVQPSRRVSVGWARGQHAQIGVGWINPVVAIVMADGGPLSWSDDFIVDGETDEHGRVWQSQWIELDRRTINQLIRELRKARDDAFGRDE